MMNSAQIKYFIKAYFYLPITFIKRVLVGTDTHYKRYFWEKWGFIEKRPLRKLNHKQLIWINTCSGGEVLQIITLSKLIQKNFPNARICLSTESDDVYRFAKDLSFIDFVFNSPWDLPGPTKRALRRVKPTLLFAIDFSNQPLLFREAQKLGIKTMLLSGKMSNDILSNKDLLRPISLKYYNFFDVIGAKELKDMEGFESLGISPKKITVTGDLKYDNHYMTMTKEEKISLAHQLGLTNSDKVFLAAGIKWDEEKMVFSAYNEAKKYILNLKFILVPRYPEQVNQVEQFLTKKDVPYVKMSELTSQNKLFSDLIIVDFFGKLPFLYSLADYVFMGSSMDTSFKCDGHNVIEPLSWHKPILFGPSMDRWQEVINKLKKVWRHCEIHNEKELTQGIIELHTNKALRAHLEKLAREITTLSYDPIQESFNLFKAHFPNEK